MNDIPLSTNGPANAAGGRDQLGRLAYSVAEAAKLTGLGKTTLYALIGNGTLPSRKIGKRRLIASTDIATLIGDCRRIAA